MKKIILGLNSSLKRLEKAFPTAESGLDPDLDKMLREIAIAQAQYDFESSCGSHEPEPEPENFEQKIKTGAKKQIALVEKEIKTTAFLIHNKREGLLLTQFEDGEAPQEIGTFMS